MSALQRDVLEQFFKREKRFFLTGGGALSGFYFGHRDTEDLDLFSVPGVSLEDAAGALDAATAACGATVEHLRTFPAFRRSAVRRGDEECIVDFVIDSTTAIEPEKSTFGEIRVDTPREIAANKVCTLLSRSELKDLVDLKQLVESGVDLAQAVQDAEKKDATVEPATLAWILDELRIGPEAALPGGGDPVALDAFRSELAKQLRGEAFKRVRK